MHGHLHKARRRRKITPARHYQRHDDPVRVAERRHVAKVKLLLVQSFNRIASLSMHEHGSTRDMSHAQVMKVINQGGLQLHVTVPTPLEIQAELKTVFDALSGAAEEVMRATIRKAQTDIADAAAREIFIQEWQTYMTGRIQQISAEVQQAVQQVAADSAHAGLSPYQTSRDIRDLIGLTDTQQGYVDSYRVSLENRTDSALNRALRNTQNDEIIQEAIDLNQTLSDEKIDQLVSRYAETWRNYRAEMIARTELIAANNAGARSAMDALIDNGDFIRDETRRFWLVALDEDTCPICLSIPELNPDGVGMDEDFDSDDGPVFEPTVHPNCRCSVTYRSGFKAEAA